MKLSRLTLVAVPATVVGCLGTEPNVRPPAVVEVRSDRVQYEPGDTVHTAMVNVGGEPVYTSLPGFYVRLEKELDGQWQDCGPWYAILAVAGTVRTIRPSDSLLAPELKLGTSPVYGNPGRYRMVYGEIYQGPAPYLPLPDSLLISNVFEVVAPENR